MVFASVSERSSRGRSANTASAVASCYATKPLLYAVIFLGGGFFFCSGLAFSQHPLALSGGYEAFLALCFLFAVVAFADAIRSKQIFAGELLILVLGLAFPIVSAALANLEFGQPIVYGIIEDRRALGLFAFFIIMSAYKFSRAQPRDLVGAIHCVSLSYLILGLILQTGVLGDLAARGVPDLDPRKHRLTGGTDLYAVSTVIGAAAFIWRNDWRQLVPVVVGLVGLAAISQTRAAVTMVMATIAMIFVMRRFYLAMALGSLFCGLALFWQLSATDNVSNVSKIGEVAIRLNTTNIIMDALAANDWIGFGALSLLWDNGFTRFYGKYFWLADVGVIGEFYRFGVLLVIFLALMGGAIYFYMNRCWRSEGWIFCLSLIIYNVLNSPGASLFAYAGMAWSLCFALATAYAPKPLRTMPSGRLMFHNLERPDRVLITSLLSLNDSGR